MLKLGYFSHTNIAPSETFIYDLVKAFNSDEDIDLIFVSGQKTTFKTDFELKGIATGYSQKYGVWANRIYKIGQLKGDNGSALKWRFRKWVANRSLQRSNLPKFDVAYIDYGTTAVLLADYLNKMGIPVVLHVHGYDVTTCLNDEVYEKKLIELFKRVSNVIVPSNHVGHLLTILGCEPNKIKTVYPIMNLENITLPSWDERRKNTPNVTFIGRLVGKKNPLALVHAFKLVVNALPEAKLFILGDGPLNQELRERISELNLIDNVKMIGTVDRKTAFNYLRSTWVYAQHSVTPATGDQEGFPVSLAEAAAHALPLVSTIHSGITENVIEGETGFLVQENDYECMAEKIIYLIRHPEVAEMMGKKGREHILQLCKQNKRAEKIKKLLYKAANKSLQQSVLMEASVV